MRLTAVLAPTLLIVVALIGWAVRETGPLAGPDERLVAGINRWISGSTVLVEVAKAITLLGDPITLYLIVGLGVGVFWRPGRIRPCLLVVLTAFTAAVTNSLLKALVDRTRPIVDHPLTSAFGQSFPSGHALGSTVTYGVILIAVWPLLAATARRWSLAVVIVLVAAVGASRVLLGVHHLSDVVAGQMLAAAWLSGALAISSRARAGAWAEQSGPTRGST